MPGHVHRLGEPGDQPGALRVTRGRQRQRPPEVRLRPVPVQRHRPVARQRQVPDRPIDQGGGALRPVGRGEQVDGLREVLGQDVADVLHAVGGGPFDPRRRGEVLVRPHRAGDLPVGDVAHQGVPEPVLGLGRHRGCPGPPDQLHPGDLLEGPFDVLAFHPRHRGHRAGPERLADDRRVGQQRLAVGGQRVQAGGDQRRDARRQRDVPVGQPPRLPLAAEQVPLYQQPDELFGEQGDATRLVGDQAQHVVGQVAAVQEAGDQRGRLPFVERRQVHPGRVAHAGAEQRFALEQLRAGRRHHGQRHRRGVAHQVVQERQERRVRPVEVLEHQDRGADLRDVLQEPLPRRERLLAVGGRLDAEADQGHQALAEPVASRLVLGREDLVELRPDHVGVVGGVDAGLGLHDLAQGPERDALAVGQAAAAPPRHQHVGILVELAEQIAHQPALADARLAAHRHQLEGRVADRPRADRPQQRPLHLAPDERPGVRPGRVAASRPAPGPVQRHRLPLPLEGDRRQRFEVEHPAGGVVRPDPHAHAADRGHRLEPRRRVHHVALDEALPGLRPGLHRHQRQPRVDPDPDPEAEARLGLVQRVDRLDDPQARGHRTLGVVLVGDGRAEHADHGVTGELLEGAAEPFELAADEVVVRVQPGLDVLGVRPVRLLGEVRQVAEQDRDDLAFLHVGDSGRRSGRAAARLLLTRHDRHRDPPRHPAEETSGFPRP